MVTIDDGLYPSDGGLYVGAYDGCTFLAEWSVADPFLNSPNDSVNVGAREKLLAAFPEAQMLAMLLHSVVNLWGYAVIERGQVIRARAGSADNGTWLEEGAALSEELTGEFSIDDSEWKEDRRVWPITPGADEGEEDAETDDTLGEYFVFAVASRWIGAAPDSSEDEADAFWSLPVERYEKPNRMRRWFKRLFAS